MGRLQRIREKLFTARETRIHPHKDDKILTDWNGLMIAALAYGGKVLHELAYIRAAEKAAEFLLQRLRRPDGRLLHRYRGGQASMESNLDDYAFLVWGLLELYGATFEAGHLRTAVELNRDMLKRFWDEKEGGLYFSPDDGEELIVRPKIAHDGAVPSGNSVALLNLFKLARLTGETDFEEKAVGVVRAFSTQVSGAPFGYTQFLVSVDFGVGPSHEVVVVGKADAEDSDAMLGALSKRYLPHQVAIFRPSSADNSEIDLLAPFVTDYVALNDKATAYVCRENRCNAPTTEVDEMLGILEAHDDQAAAE
jgi:uncharacterized protein YyaL (SSP411 family)